MGPSGRTPSPYSFSSFESLFFLYRHQRSLFRSELFTFSSIRLDRQIGGLALGSLSGSFFQSLPLQVREGTLAFSAASFWLFPQSHTREIRCKLFFFFFSPSCLPRSFSPLLSPFFRGSGGLQSDSLSLGPRLGVLQTGFRCTPRTFDLVHPLTLSTLPYLKFAPLLVCDWVPRPQNPGMQ